MNTVSGEKKKLVFMIYGFNVSYRRRNTFLEKRQTLQESFEFGAVHVDVADELDIVDVHRVF